MSLECTRTKNSDALRHKNVLHSLTMDQRLEIADNENCSYIDMF
jgi:hypothetical protein